MRRGLRGKGLGSAAAVLVGLLACSRLAYAELRITYPTANAAVPGRVIEIRGTGADPNGTLEVEVLTNDWYVQTGRARINKDGSWSYGPCHLGGEGEFNNHTIRVTIVKKGKRGESTSVGGIVRK